MDLDRSVSVTLDVDWAPDFAIRDTAELLVAAGVPATWFVTHLSPAIEDLRKHPQLFELGIHPNFRPGSSHGKSEDDVLRHCMDLVPDAVSLRTHSLVWSSPLLTNLVATTPIRVDSSLFLPRRPWLRPFTHQAAGNVLYRVPIFFSDDYEFAHPQPLWDIAELTRADVGPRVFTFHPIHVFLNSADDTAYSALKTAHPDLVKAGLAAARSYVREGVGTRSVFRALLERFADRGVTLRHLWEAGGEPVIASTQ